jgi:predicted nuclease with TOPRIM domain
MSVETRIGSLKLLLDLYEKMINDFKNVKKELDECNNKIDEIIQENENLKNENKRLQGDLDILHNFNDSLMRFGCVREFVNNNINIMDDLEE